ncbi:hypothetical protein Nepgr_022361 [Nepenthes gracilis]|uniref:RRM domain-containing protein n=1 Tax=Nepenthes gracilis TaxID=150966 RepID=A0AAD3XY42_NEPGR|nr:hypothetical protein Nepgr_022361 [Nepenthes gracilis]
MSDPFPFHLQWPILVRNCQGDAVNRGNTLFATGLPSRITEWGLEEHFSKEGKVSDIVLVVEPRAHISRGFAFVTLILLRMLIIVSSILTCQFLKVVRSLWRR